MTLSSLYLRNRKRSKTHLALEKMENNSVNQTIMKILTQEVEEQEKETDGTRDSNQVFE
jgi:hypothetical protein